MPFIRLWKLHWVLAWKCVGICQMFFSVSVEVIMLFIPPSLCYCGDWFFKKSIEPPCIPGINPCCIVLLISCWVWFASVFCWGFLDLCSWEIVVCSFLVKSFSVVSGKYQLMQWIRKYSFFFHFLKSEEHWN